MEKQKKKQCPNCGGYKVVSMTVVNAFTSISLAGLSLFTLFVFPIVGVLLLAAALFGVWRIFVDSGIYRCQGCGWKGTSLDKK